MLYFTENFFGLFFYKIEEQVRVRLDKEAFSGRNDK